MQRNTNRIVFTGGGTGGHVFPALAVYHYLPQPLQQRVLWVGSYHGVERSIVRDAGVSYRAIPTGKLRRYAAWENLTDVGRVFAGVAHAYRALEDVSLVFSKGGFVAVPVVYAAALRGIPVLIHESDNDPGLATRLTAPIARRIFVPYADMQGILRATHPKVIVSGNPVRPEILNADPAAALPALGLVDAGLPVILITGGSIGARQLNEATAAIAARLTERAGVLHQTGAPAAPAPPPPGGGGLPPPPRPPAADPGGRRAAALSAVGRASRYCARPFFGAEMGALVARADVVVARSGAGTVWELAALGRPAVLVPLSASVSRGDQVRNARRYRRAGAAVVIPSDRFTSQRLMGILDRLLEEPARLESMREAARGWAAADAAARIAAEIERWYRRGGNGV